MPADLRTRAVASPREAHAGGRAAVPDADSCDYRRGVRDRVQPVASRRRSLAVPCWAQVQCAAQEHRREADAQLCPEADARIGGRDANSHQLTHRTVPTPAREAAYGVPESQQDQFRLSTHAMQGPRCAASWRCTSRWSACRHPSVQPPLRADRDATLPWTLLSSRPGSRSMT
jgi:hypothetical protein